MSLVSQVVKGIVFVGFWAILLAGIYAAIDESARGTLGNWAIFLPMWGVVTAMVTYSALDDVRRRRRPAGPQS